MKYSILLIVISFIMCMIGSYLLDTYDKLYYSQATCLIMFGGGIGMLSLPVAISAYEHKTIKNTITECYKENIKS